MRFDVNSIGERGPEPPSGPGSVYRVLAVGGSAVECMLLDQSVSWPGALAGILNRAENRELLGVSRVHVGNIGKSGLDSRALHVALHHVLPHCRNLNAIVVMVGGSNVMRWLTAGAPADAAAPPVSYAEIFDWQPNGPFRFRPRLTAFAEIARRLRQRVLRPTESRHRAGKFLIKMRAMRRRGLFRDTLPDATAMADDYEAGLREALITAMQHSPRVILARQPWFDKDYFTPEEDACLWHGGLSNAFVEEVRSFASSKAICQLMSQLDQRALAVANELGVEQIDLPGMIEPSLSHYYDILHFTPAGSLRVAEAVADSLLYRAGRGAVRSDWPSERHTHPAVAPALVAAARSGSSDCHRRIVARETTESM